MKYDVTPADVDVVVVDWADIVRVENWNDDEEVDFIEAACVGWLLEDSPKRIVLASSYNYDTDTWADYHIFPKQAPTVRK